jgi:hypothetical protein
MVQPGFVSSGQAKSLTESNAFARSELTSPTEAQVASRERGSKLGAALGSPDSATGDRLDASLELSTWIPWSRCCASWSLSSSCVTCTLDLTLASEPILIRLLWPTPCKWEKAWFLIFNDKVWTRGKARAYHRFCQPLCGRAGLWPTPCKWGKAGFLMSNDKVWTRGKARAYHRFLPTAVFFGLAYGLHLANGERLGSLFSTTRCGPEARHVPTIDFCQPLCFWAGLWPTPCKWEKAGFLSSHDKVWTRGGKVRAHHTHPRSGSSLRPSLTQHVGPKPNAGF